MKVLIIRHGDPDYKNDTLTEKGHIEARLLSRRLAGEHITNFYCSPLGRARDTAAPTLSLYGSEAETVKLFREFSVPVTVDYEGRGMTVPPYGIKHSPWDLTTEFADRYSEDLFDRENWMRTPPFDSEEMTERVNQIGEVYDGIIAASGYKRHGLLYDIDPDCNRNAVTAIFCHMGLGLLLISHITKIPPPQVWNMFVLLPSSVTEVIYDPVLPGMDVARARLFRVGDTSHLYDGQRDK